jgi:hypothetical protein
VAKKSISKQGHKRVGKKIGQLMKKEGVPRKQAIATALSMQRAHRLGPKGGYKRKGS